MSNRISEVGLFVVTEKMPVASLHEIGLFVLHDAGIPAAEARLKAMGLMVLFSAPSASSRSGEQGHILGRSSSIQGNGARRLSSYYRFKVS